MIAINPFSPMKQLFFLISRLICAGTFAPQCKVRFERLCARPGDSGLTDDRPTPDRSNHLWNAASEALT